MPFQNPQGSSSPAVTPVISAGDGAPTAAPSKSGNIYVDTTNNQAYVSSSTTWIPVLLEVAFSVIHAALDAGLDPVFQVIGDSTSDETNEFAYLVATEIANQRADAHVRIATWNDSTQAFAVPTVIQAANGQHGIVFTGSAGRRIDAAEVPAVVSDLDISAKLSMVTWTPAAQQAIVSRYGGAGARSYSLIVDSAGKPRLQWSNDGTTVVTSVATTAVSFTAGQTGWVRATLVLSTGAVLFYSSTDGVTWTSLGGPAAVGVTTLFANTARYIEYGSRSGIDLLVGTLYEAYIRDGLIGKVINPQSVLSAYALDDTDTNTKTGSPTLYVINASKGGADYAYWSDSTRFPKAVYPFTVGTVLVSQGLNTSSVTGAIGLKALFDALATLIAARVPTLVPMLITQNPKTLATVPPASVIQTNIDMHAMRQYMTAALAVQRGWAVIDTFRAFIRDPRGLANLIEPDFGVHPNTTGGRALESSVIAAKIKAGR